MPGFKRTAWPGIVGIYVGAVGAGYAASWLKIPLPWMIGPMLFAGAVSALTRSPRVPRITRPVGQTIVASVVGLAFTPSTVSAVAEQIIAMLAAALMMVLAGFLTSVVLMRLTRADLVAASLASVPGGPVEMSDLASRYGIDPGPVAFAQTMRITFLVLIIPTGLLAIEGASRDVSPVLLSGGGDHVGTILLLAIATAGGFLFRWIGATSPFFLGALAFTGVASALSLPISMPPYWVLATAQVLLGVWLGCMLNRAILVEAPGFVFAVLVSTAVLVALCIGLALAISVLTGIDWRTMVLATAPGSVTEMSLTASILHQGVAMVTAFHVVRIFMILSLAPLIFAATNRLAKRYARGPKRREGPND